MTHLKPIDSRHILYKPANHPVPSVTNRKHSHIGCAQLREAKVFLTTNLRQFGHISFSIGRCHLLTAVACYALAGERTPTWDDHQQGVASGAPTHHYLTKSYLFIQQAPAGREHPAPPWLGNKDN